MRGLSIRHSHTTISNLSITDEEEQIHEDTRQQPDGVEASTLALPGDSMPLTRLTMDARVLTSTPEKELLLELSAEEKKTAKEPKS